MEIPDYNHSWHRPRILLASRIVLSGPGTEMCQRIITWTTCLDKNYTEAIKLLEWQSRQFQESR